MAETPGRLRLLRGTAAQWSSANPILLSGEIGYDTTNNLVKIGDSVTTWSALPGIGGGPGATDHGTLTGLADDDHPQYALLADAAALCTSTPLSSLPGGYAGTAATAARCDHRHPPTPSLPSIEYKTTKWTTPQNVEGSPASFTIGRLFVFPYYLAVRDGRAITISAIGLVVTTGGSSDSTAKVGFYASDTAGYPDLTQKLVEGTITLGTGTGEKSITLGSNYTFPADPELYWAAFLPLGTTAPTFRLGGPSVPTILNNETSGMDPQPKAYATTGQTVLPTTQIGLNNGNEAPPALFIRPV